MRSMASIAISAFQYHRIVPAFREDKAFPGYISLLRTPELRWTIWTNFPFLPTCPTKNTKAYISYPLHFPPTQPFHASPITLPPTSLHLFPTPRRKTSLLKSPLRRFPIHNIPHGGKVFGFAVFVLKASYADIN